MPKLARHSTFKKLPSFDASNTGTESIQDKTFRVRIELISAGMTRYGLRKFNTHYLPTIIQDGEHIMAVIYGRYSEGPGLLSWVDRMVVATDRRIISLNHKPGFTDIEDLTYDVINGVEATNIGVFCGVKVSSKADSYSLRFVNRNCAQKFVQYVEKRRQEFFESSRPM